VLNTAPIRVRALGPELYRDKVLGNKQ
jgi:hypothetical protein